MSSSRKKQSSSIIAPVGHMLGSTFLSFAKSRLPVPNKLKTRTHRRGFLNVAPVPFAPLIDTHAFPPPPPYSAYLDDPSDFLPVPNNTPETPAATVAGHSLFLGTSIARHAQPVGLGLDGVEKGDGGQFDGLGRLSGGFKARESASDALRDEVQRMLDEHSRRRRTRASEQPAKRQDVFFASVEVQACERVVSGVPTTVKIRIRRKSATSPTPLPKRWEGVTRGTIASELRRAASLERRASLKAMHVTAWRV